MILNSGNILFMCLREVFFMGDFILICSGVLFLYKSGVLYSYLNLAKSLFFGLLLYLPKL